MRHALMYHGGLERNFPKLAPGATTFEGTDGKEHQLHEWPASAYLRIGYMEKAGKKFCVVRVMDGQDDCVVKNELILESGRHLGFGIHLGPEPTLVEDDSVIMTLVEDLAKRNAEHQEVTEKLLRIRARFKALVAEK